MSVGRGARRRVNAGIAICLFAAAGCGAGSRPHPPAPTPAAPSRVALHVQTWAIDDGCGGGAGAPAALVRQWVTFAETNCGVSATKARADCHAAGSVSCQVMQYLDSDWDFGDEWIPPPANASADDWWLHDPAPHRGTSIYSVSDGGGYLFNQSNAATRSFFRSYVRAHYDSDDGLLMDWQSPSLQQELYYARCRCSGTSEIRSNAALRTGHEEMSAALSHIDGSRFVQADNSLPLNPYLPQGFDMLNRATGVDGWIAEGVPEQDGVLDRYYSTLLDQIAYIATKTTGFVVPLSRARAGASYQSQSRRVQEATILLGYSPGHLVDWADLEDGSRNLAVWPEEGIYPTDPVQSMGAPGGSGCLAGTGQVCTRGGHTSLQVAPGVYRREFGACYRHGVRFGPCATVVNTSAVSVTVQPGWLTKPYGNQITFHGGDVQSGGTLDLTGQPFSVGATRVSSHDAVLLAR